MNYEQPTTNVIDFYRYPPLGDDDWRYLFEVGQIRVFETQMLGRTTFIDMADAEDFRQAADLLASSEYVLPGHGEDFNQVENVLMIRRTAVRRLFENFMLDKPIVKLFKSRDDFANMRLIMRRAMTKKPLGTDYSSDGNIPPEQLKEAFEQENYDLLPDYMRQAAEQATLAYYQNKGVRRIDYAIDNIQAEYNLETALRLKSIFLLGLFKIQIDLTNIRTMFRLKFAGQDSAFVQENVFLKGGYLQLERIRQGLDTGYESLGQLFFVTPYYEIVEGGANYLLSRKSFLKAEWCCEDYLTGFLKTTIQIATGPQPIIAYLLMKEGEIRTVRLILTAKKNMVDTRLILDRLGE